jgi:hypothetical protein
MKRDEMNYDANKMFVAAARGRLNSHEGVFDVYESKARH